MNAATYKQQRDRLLELLDKINAVEEIDPKYKQEFVSTRKKCLENQFNIVLAGEFQGGKSTTFNTLCDGREISPRGAMTKTSACKITAQNLAETAADEFALIEWKSGPELILGMMELVKDVLLAEFPERLSVSNERGEVRPMSNLEIAEIISLDNGAEKKLIYNALLAEWQRYKTNKRDYDEEKLDLLCISLLTVHFYDHEEVLRMKETARCSPGHIHHLITFPVNWNRQWQDDRWTGFAPAEIAFVFVGAIQCNIHSANLQRLGCTVTDCPGLFASPWDTAVAEEAMLAADAILYLVGGSKTLSLQETGILKRIRYLDMEHKLFFAINMRISKDTIQTVVIPNDVAMLNSIGFPVNIADIRPYHAFLAFAAAFGNRYLSGDLEEASEKAFISLLRRLDRSQDTGLGKSWLKMVQQALAGLGVPFEEISALDPGITQRNIDFMKSYDGFSALLDDIESYIIKTKAFSILIPNGVERALNSLIKVEADLQQMEEDAKKDEKTAMHEYRIAEEALEEFRTYAGKVIGEAFQPEVYQLLKHSFYNEVLIGAAEGISHDASKSIEARVISERWSLLWTGLVKNKETRNQRIKELVEPTMRQAMEDHINSLSSAWISKLSHGKDMDYKNSVIREVQRINGLLQEKWSRVENLERLVNVPINLPSGNPMDDRAIFESFQGSGGITDEIENFWQPVAKGLWLEAIMWILIAPGMSIMWLIEMIFHVFSPGNMIDEHQQEAVAEELSDTAKRMKERISLHLNRFFNDREQRQVLEDRILGFLGGIGAQYQTLYQNILAEQKNTLETSLRESKKRFSLNFEKRKKIAEEAHLLRTTTITPLKERAEQFKKETLELLQYDK